MDDAKRWYLRCLIVAFFGHETFCHHELVNSRTRSEIESVSSRVREHFSFSASHARVCFLLPRSQLSVLLNPKHRTGTTACLSSQNKNKQTTSKLWYCSRKYAPMPQRISLTTHAQQTIHCNLTTSHWIPPGSLWRVPWDFP